MQQLVAAAAAGLPKCCSWQQDAAAAGLPSVASAEEEEEPAGSTAVASSAASGVTTAAASDCRSMGLCTPLQPDRPACEHHMSPHHPLNFGSSDMVLRPMTAQAPRLSFGMLSSASFPCAVAGPTMLVFLSKKQGQDQETRAGPELPTHGPPPWPGMSQNSLANSGLH